MNLSSLPFAGYTQLLDLRRPVEALLQMIKLEAPLLLTTSKDEDYAQDIIVDIIQFELECIESGNQGLVKLNLSDS